MNEEKYEVYQKLKNSKWYFIGWGTMMNEENCIETKVRGNYTYKTYKWLNGKIDEFKYKTK